jgi:phenol 2-monooxygenase
VRAVFQQEVDDLPAALLPRRGRFGLIDYEKAFRADPGNDIFAARGIDRDAGCVVVVRPDQYVAHVLPLDAHAALAEFFAAQKPSGRPTSGRV